MGGMAGMGGKGLGAIGGIGGGVGAAGAVVAAGAVGFGVGTLITKGIEWGESEATAGGNQAAHRDHRVFNTQSAVNKAAMGGSDDDMDSALAAAERVRAELTTDIQNAKDPTSYAGAIFGGKSIEEAGKEQADSQHLPELMAMLTNLNASIETLTRKRLKVDANIESMPMMSGGVNQSGRSGVGG
jgi:hypothetical protein